MDRRHERGNYAGANNWRLWSALNSDGTGPCGPAFNCNDSELGHLFYVEGGLSQFQAMTASPTLNADAFPAIGAFSNLQDFVYWSGTDYAPSPGYAWPFYASDGHQGGYGRVLQGYGWAVRSGQVAAAPLPGTAVLMALGLIGLGARKLGRRATLVIR